jgi:hypothetical protein
MAEAAAEARSEAERLQSGLAELRATATWRWRERLIAHRRIVRLYRWVRGLGGGPGRGSPPAG